MIINAPTQANRDRATITCFRRKNTPRVFVAVCKQCRYGAKCSSYQKYVNPTLFESIKKRKRKTSV